MTVREQPAEEPFVLSILVVLMYKEEGNSEKGSRSPPLRREEEAERRHVERMQHGVNPETDEERVERQRKERNERYERRRNQRTTNPTRGRTTSPPGLVGKDHQRRSRSEDRDGVVEEIFLDQLTEEHERFKQENLEDSEGEYLEQETPLGSFKLRKIKRKT